MYAHHGNTFCQVYFNEQLFIVTMPVSLDLHCLLLLASPYQQEGELEVVRGQSLLLFLRRER